MTTQTFHQLPGQQAPAPASPAASPAARMTVTRLDTSAIPDQTGHARPTAPLPPPPVDFDCGPLLLALKAEQEALEFLSYKLRVQNLLLAAGDVRWLAAVNAELEEAVNRIGVVSHQREQLAEAADRAHGLVSGRLSDLAGRVADEWSCQQLLQRQAVLRDLLETVRRCSKENQQMLAHGLAATTDALSILGRVPTYTAAGAVKLSTASISIDTRA